jgi:molybdopterin-guanine dinucleotide biosynthesis protein A
LNEYVHFNGLAGMRQQEKDIRVPGPARDGGPRVVGARTAGIVLAGGRSTRMGRPKASLEWHGSTLLHRVAGIVARAVDGPVVVVRAPGQELPSLPPGVRVVEDAREGRGPLQGLAAGLSAVAEDAELAYVSSTDLPLLHPAFVAAVLAGADREDVDVALPVAQGFKQPLAAAYRTSLLADVDELIMSDRMRPAFLFERCQVRELDESDLLRDARVARADPDLLSLRNLNNPADYEEARARPEPPVTVRRFGTLAPAGDRQPLALRAATLGAAAAAAGVPLNRHVVAALNGDQITRDPELPLAAGDVLAFLAADAGG